jgi:hypothetical protein
LFHHTLLLPPCRVPIPTPPPFSIHPSLAPQNLICLILTLTWLWHAKGQMVKKKKAMPALK